MKIESTRYICDITRKECQDMTDTEHSAALSFHFGYGSNLHGAHGEFHLSRTTAEDVWALLSAKYPQLKLEQG